MIENKAVTVLASGIVIDKSKVNGLSALETSKLFAEAYSGGVPVMIVDNASTFFSSKSLLEMIDKGNSDWVVVAEKFKLDLSTEDLICMKRASEIRASIAEAVSGSYEMAPVPMGWVLENHITVGSIMIRRQSNSYSIGKKSLLAIWTMASSYWSGQSKTRSMPIRADGYHKTAMVQGDLIEIGCQTVARFEIEQVAVQLNWPFPQ